MGRNRNVRSVQDRIAQASWHVRGRSAALRSRTNTERAIIRGNAKVPDSRPVETGRCGASYELCVNGCAREGKSSCKQRISGFASARNRTVQDTSSGRAWTARAYRSAKALEIDCVTDLRVRRMIGEF